MLMLILSLPVEMDRRRLQRRSPGPAGGPDRHRLPLCRSPGRVSPPQRPLQRPAQAGQHERHGERRAAGSPVLGCALATAIRAALGETAPTHTRRVALIVNVLKDSVPLLVLNRVSASARWWGWGSFKKVVHYSGFPAIGQSFWRELGSWPKGLGPSLGPSGAGRMAQESGRSEKQLEICTKRCWT